MQKFVLRLLIFAFAFILLQHILVWFYEKPIRQAIKNKTHDKFLKWHDIKNTGNNYNIIFLGSSRGYSAYNPIIIDSILNTNSYNMCTGSQHIIESYYMLKEILRYQKPKIVIYEMFLPSFGDVVDYYHVLSNGSFMSKRGEFDLIVHGFGSEGIANFLLPLLKHKFYIINDVLALFKVRKTQIESGTHKWIKGYYYDENIASKTTIEKWPPIDHFDKKNLPEKNLEYLQALLELCRKNDVKLICVRAPFPPSRFKISRLEGSSPNATSTFFAGYCKDYNIPFYDFNNIADSGYVYSDFDFADYNHMNKFGAGKVSNQLARLLSKERTLNNLLKTGNSPLN
jgi:hypothetical protein